MTGLTSHSTFRSKCLYLLLQSLLMKQVFVEITCSIFMKLLYYKIHLQYTQEHNSPPNLILKSWIQNFLRARPIEEFRNILSNNKYLQLYFKIIFYWTFILGWGATSDLIMYRRLLQILPKGFRSHYSISWLKCENFGRFKS